MVCVFSSHAQLPQLKYLLLNECSMLRTLPPEHILKKLTLLELLDLSGCATLFQGYKPSKPAEIEEEELDAKIPEVDIDALAAKAADMEMALFEEEAEEEEDDDDDEDEQDVPAPTSKPKAMSQLKVVGRFGAAASRSAMPPPEPSPDGTVSKTDDVLISIDILIGVALEHGHDLLVVDAKGKPIRSGDPTVERPVLPGYTKPTLRKQPTAAHSLQRSKSHRFEVRPETPATNPMGMGGEGSGSGSRDELVRAKTPLDMSARRPTIPKQESRDAAMRRQLVFEHDKIQARLEGLFSHFVDDMVDDTTAVEERVRRTIDARWPSKKRGGTLWY